MIIQLKIKESYRLKNKIFLPGSINIEIFLLKSSKRKGILYELDRREKRGECLSTKNLC